MVPSDAHRDRPARRSLPTDPRGDRRRDRPHRGPRGRRRGHPPPRRRRGRRRAVLDHLALRHEGGHPRGRPALDRAPRGRAHPGDRRPAGRHRLRPVGVGGGARRLADRAGHRRARDRGRALPAAGRAARLRPARPRSTASGARACARSASACSSTRRRRRRSSTSGSWSPRSTACGWASSTRASRTSSGCGWPSAASCRPCSADRSRRPPGAKGRLPGTAQSGSSSMPCRRTISAAFSGGVTLAGGTVGAWPAR